MYKFYVKVTYPDMNIPTCPEVTTVFTIYAKNSEKAVERAFHWGVAIVKDILIHNQINPYTIDLVAPELVRVVKCRLWEAQQQQ